MKDKEKQIEEMAEDLANSYDPKGEVWGFWDEDYPSYYNYTNMSKNMYSLGYRKLPEDSVVIFDEFVKFAKDKFNLTIVKDDTKKPITFEELFGKVFEDSIVLSREEYEEYQKFKSFMKRNDWESVDDIETTLDKCQEVLYERLQQERKETAEKFIKECKKYKVKKFSPIGIDQRKTGVSWIEMPEWKFDEFAKQFGVEIKE